jgi:hypothetical protein
MIGIYTRYTISQIPYYRDAQYNCYSQGQNQFRNHVLVKIA